MYLGVSKLKGSTHYACLMKFPFVYQLQNQALEYEKCYSESSNSDNRYYTMGSLAYHNKLIGFMYQQSYDVS